jgi:hypothetical protein
MCAGLGVLGPVAVEAAFALKGAFNASKGRQARSAANHVQIMLQGWRLPGVHSDVILTLTTPLYVSELSAAAKDVGPGPKTQHISSPTLFAEVVHSFKILDAGLFGS